VDYCRDYSPAIGGFESPVTTQDFDYGVVDNNLLCSVVMMVSCKLAGSKFACMEMDYCEDYEACNW